MDIIKAIAVALVLAAAPAHAAKPSADVPVEMGMRVEGALAIGSDGRITALEIDKQDMIPEAVATLVRDTVQKWEFEPQLRDGVAVPTDTRMTVRVVARPTAASIAASLDSISLKSPRPNWLLSIIFWILPLAPVPGSMP